MVSIVKTQFQNGLRWRECLPATIKYAVIWTQLKKFSIELSVLKTNFDSCCLFYREINSRFSQKGIIRFRISHTGVFCSSPFHIVFTLMCPHMLDALFLWKCPKVTCWVFSIDKKRTASIVFNYKIGILISGRPQVWHAISINRN